MSRPEIPLDFARLPIADQLEASRDLLKRFSNRRTVRTFAPDPVPLELIENAIRFAATAPSGANQQPWRFIVVADPAIKREIRIAAEAEEKENYERRFPDEWLHALEPFHTDWRKPFIEIAPYLIAIFRIDYGLDDNGQRFKHYYVQESVGIATGFLLVALHMAGLAALTHTPNPMGFLNRILDRPVNERPFLLMPVGYPAAGATVPDITKKPLDEVLILRTGPRPQGSATPGPGRQRMD